MRVVTVGRRRIGSVLVLAALAVTGFPTVPAAHAETVPFSIDANYVAKFERDYTTRFPSRWTNQPTGTAWRTGHDGAALFIRDEWRRLIAPLAKEGAFAELRPFNLEDPAGVQPDFTDPGGAAGPENNVLAFIPGSDPALRTQVVVVGGHFDCVDITVDGGLDCGMQMPASTGVLEGLVRYWTANNLRPRRSLAMFAIDGEEQCLCGSVHYTTLGSPNALFEHLEFPAALSVVAYHDTDMIGANYPSRYFGLSTSDFMPMNVMSAPTVDDPTRILAPFASYYGAIANPAFLARFKLYRQAILRQRDRFFADMHKKYPTWTYRDGVTKPLFTDEQKKYVVIEDDPLDRSDHTVFIANGIPADINIGLSDVDVAPPGWLSYHHVGETEEEVNYFRGGDMRLTRDALLGYEATSAWIAYISGAAEDSPMTEPFFLGQTAPAASPLPAFPGLKLSKETAVLPALPASQTGAAWRPVGPRDAIVRELAIDPRDARRIYAATQDRGLLISQDGGATWAESNTGLGAFISLWGVTPDPNVPGRVWVSSHHGGVFRSDNGGMTWRATDTAAQPRAADVVYKQPANPVSSTDVLQSNITVDQSHTSPGGKWLYGFDQCLPQYAPSGQQCATRADWPAKGFDKYPMMLHTYRYGSEVAVLPDGTVAAAGFSTYVSGGGIFRSTNGGAQWTYTWRTTPTGTASPGDSNLWRVRASGSRLYASGTAGVFRSDDGGSSWTATAAKPAGEVRALVTDPTNVDTVYAGAWDDTGGVFKTTDGGKTWTAASNGIPAHAGIAALAVDPADAKHVAAATYWYGVYLSSDGGATWKLAADAMPAATRHRLDDVDFAPDGTLFASSHDGVWALGGTVVSAGTATRTAPARLPATGGGLRAGIALVALTGAALLGRRRRRRSVPLE
jgi:photosystem II stability/assembly factor-like uncharacterized protein